MRAAQMLGFLNRDTITFKFILYNPLVRSHLVYANAILLSLCYTLLITLICLGPNRKHTYTEPTSAIQNLLAAVFLIGTLKAPPILVHHNIFYYQLITAHCW